MRTDELKGKRTDVTVDIAIYRMGDRAVYCARLENVCAGMHGGGFESSHRLRSLILFPLLLDESRLSRGPVAFLQHLQFLAQFHHAAVGQDATKIRARINHAVASQD